MIKLLTVALFGVLLSASFANGQKLAYINSSELIALMPERDSAVIKMQNFQKELAETGQSMEADYNTKAKEFQDKRNTWAPAVVDSKTKELSDLEQRINQFYQQAQQDLAQRQETLMAPIVQKAQDAINKVAKEQGIAYVLEASSMVYVDTAQAINLLAAVKAELGIPASKTQPTQIN